MIDTWDYGNINIVCLFVFNSSFDDRSLDRSLLMADWGCIGLHGGFERSGDNHGTKEEFYQGTHRLLIREVQRYGYRTHVARETVGPCLPGGV